jgi:hypothetical protein
MNGHKGGARSCARDQRHYAPQTAVRTQDAHAALWRLRMQGYDWWGGLGGRVAHGHVRLSAPLRVSSVGATRWCGRVAK